MKAIVNILSIMCLCIISYLIGNDKAKKHQEAACFYADVVHCMMDDSKANVNIYKNWINDFDSLEFKHLEKEDLKNYYWCY